jgi:uncharacterized membrane protein
MADDHLAAFVASLSLEERRRLADLLERAVESNLR